MFDALSATDPDPRPGTPGPWNDLDEFSQTTPYAVQDSSTPPCPPDLIGAFVTLCRGYVETLGTPVTVILHRETKVEYSAQLELANRAQGADHS